MESWVAPGEVPIRGLNGPANSLTTICCLRGIINQRQRSCFAGTVRADKPVHTPSGTVKSKRSTARSCPNFLVTPHSSTAFISRNSKADFESNRLSAVLRVFARSFAVLAMWATTNKKHPLKTVRGGRNRLLATTATTSPLADRIRRITSFGKLVNRVPPADHPNL